MCTHVANHDLLRRFGIETSIRACATVRCVAAVASTHATHARLLVRARIVRIQVLAREVAPGSTASEAPTESSAHTSAESTATQAPHATTDTTTVGAGSSEARVAVLTYLERPAVPLEAIVHACMHRIQSIYNVVTQTNPSSLTDGLRGILGCLENDGAGSLGASVEADVDVRTDDVARGAEEVLQVLPASLVWEL